MRCIMHGCYSIYCLCQKLQKSSFRRMPESSYLLNPLDPGLRRGDDNLNYGLKRIFAFICG